MPSNTANFGAPAAEIGWRVWGTPANFSGRVSRLGSVTARYSSSGRQPNFVVFNRGCNLGRPSRWALAYILVFGASRFFVFF